MAYLQPAQRYAPVRDGSPAPGTEPQTPMLADSMDTIESVGADMARRAFAFALALPTLPTMPTMPRFLADFTLGFADGLTVPFALTAGLSFLGETDTVIRAGMAEVCAGSISMGIGGYLAAQGEAAAAAAREERDGVHGNSGAEEEEAEEEGDAGAGAGLLEKHDGCPDHVESYLAPLELPTDLRYKVVGHLAERPHLARALAGGRGLRDDDSDDDSNDNNHQPHCSPVLSGISIFLGYLVGGSLPLFPYFFVAKVGDGLFWSIIVCGLALFTFGFGKDFVLRYRASRSRKRSTSPYSATNLWRSTWEGFRMTALGGVAAVAAILCVRPFQD